MRKNFFSFLLITSCISLFTQPTSWYFSSSGGNDNNTGISPSSPWKSTDRLQSLLSGNTFNGKKLQRGDTIYFLRGDTFRFARITPTLVSMGVSFNGTVFTSSGTQYITLRDYGPSSAPLPVLKSSLRLDQTPSGNVIQQGNLIKISNPFLPHNNFVVTRMFYKGKPMVLARFPNDSTLLVEQSKTAANTIDSLYSSALNSIPNAHCQGAVIWATMSGYSWGISHVLDKQSNLLRVSPGDFHAGPMRGNRFYLENKREFLDKPGEWYFDKNTDTLYFLLPQNVTSFNKADYEIQFSQLNPSANEPRIFILTHSQGYTAMPSNPIQRVNIQNLQFEHGQEAIRMAGVKHVEISNCNFIRFFRALWTFLGEDMKITGNKFLFNEYLAIAVGGRMVAGYEGNPAAMTKRVLIENNLIKYTGWENRWRTEPLYNTLTNTHTQEDYSMNLGRNVDSVIVRKNRIDSVSQGGIVISNFYMTETNWNNQYPGKIPFIIEKNYITNYCTDFSDCGGIKAYSFLNGSIIKNNILYKDIWGKHNRNKTWQADYRFTLTHYGGNGYGLYSDVNAHTATFESNTSVGADINHHNFPGGTFIKKIYSKKNTLYGATMKEIDYVSSGDSNSKIDSCRVEENLFFHLTQADGAVMVNDASNDNFKDTLWVMNKNRYFLPNRGAHYIYRYGNGTMLVTGFYGIKNNTPYEASPISYWGQFAKHKYWNNSNIILSNLINNSSFTTNPLPISAFGGAQVATVAASPLGGLAVRITCTNNPPSWGAGFLTTTLNPLYSSTLSPHDVYKISFVLAAAKKKEYDGFMNFNMKHPKTGDQLGGRDYFVFPAFKGLQPDTFEIYYKPRLFQYNNMFRIYVQKNDTVWLKFLKFEKIDTSSVKPLSFYYPIFLNPSDNPASFNLNPCYVYLDTDSNVVINSVTVAPWSSRILIWQKCDSSLLSVKSHELIQKSSVLVYPNPAKDQFFIMNGAFVRYEFIDIKGTVISSGTLPPGHHSIPAAGLPQGLYLIQTYRIMEDGSIEKHSFKLLKE
ncbi:MAG: T9SS type A sorting domain-containing protein [Bacteroidia bacterium]|nr:T9SS type A sorting domain-containing protein [Bacteroidia bacterium]